MTDFRHINRLMGTGREMRFQMENGDFNDRLSHLMNRVDPYWEDREKTEMDIYERQAPVKVVTGDEGKAVERTAHTARTPSTDENGSPNHRQEGTIIASELLVKGQMELELPE